MPPELPPPRRRVPALTPDAVEERMREEYWEPDCAPVLDAIAAWLGPPYRRSPLALSVSRAG